MCCMQNNNNRVNEKVATAFSAFAGRLTCIALVALAAAWLPQNSRAATSLWWDANGATAGASPGGGLATGTWGTDIFWSTTSAGTDPGAWTSGSIAIFSAGTDASGTFTVTLNGTQTAGGVTFEDGTLTLTSGTLSLSAGSVVTLGVGRSAVIDSVIAGTTWTKTGSGMLTLSGTNSFSGGRAQLKRSTSASSFSTCASVTMV